MSYNYSNMHLSFQSLKIPPSGNPRALDRRPCPWGGEFKPCLAGMENLTGSGVKSFQRKTRVLYFNMVMFKGKELTLASERLRRKGLQGLSLKTRSMRVGEGGEDFEASNRSTHQ